MYKYTECRTFGHAWQPLEVDITSDIGYAVLLVCLRCATTRKDVMNRRGGLSYRAYHKPDDYALDHVYTKDEWRTDFLEERVPRRRRKVS